ncbi:hypothetical protein Nepgr_013286 [Nepenthes gracilis]|uniref:Uncharacterized protein n=1 Tax=Nepenthes gracilis TaxID=150966 RepID=A0AAD3XP86_NEPGR|nr:hypothetical protein Nepgr_013286 [Nepenthes gracilis]
MKTWLDITSLDNCYKTSYIHSIEDRLKLYLNNVKLNAFKEYDVAQFYKTHFTTTLAERKRERTCAVTVAYRCCLPSGNSKSVDLTATKMHKNKQGAKGGTSRSLMESNDQDLDIRNIMKEIELLGSSCMTWKERKELENKKIVTLGGKPPKKQRLPLSVARVVMKKQKEREQKMLKENPMLERLRGNLGKITKQPAVRHRSECIVLKPSEGHFRNGVLDVKNLLRPTPSSSNNDSSVFIASRGKKKRGGLKRGGKKNHGKKNGGRKRH